MELEGVNAEGAERKKRLPVVLTMSAKTSFVGADG